MDTSRGRGRALDKGGGVKKDGGGSVKRKRTVSGEGSKDGKKSRHASGDTVINKVNPSERTECNMCKELFDQSEFRRHSRSKHLFNCDQPDCTYSLESEIQLLNHKKKVHMIMPPGQAGRSNWRHQCEACGKEFSEKAIAKHKVTSHDFPCDSCPLRFVNDIHLKSHIKAVHQSPVPVKVRKVSEHRRSVEVVEVVEVSPPPLLARIVPDTKQAKGAGNGKQTKTKQYWRCPLCLDLFSCAKKLEDHLEKTGEKHDKSCGQCSFMFVTNVALIKHNTEKHGVSKGVKKCKLCMEVVDIKSMAGHMKKNHQFDCGVDGCNAVCTTAVAQWEHRIKVHGEGVLVNKEDFEDRPVDKVLMAKEDKESSEKEIVRIKLNPGKSESCNLDQGKKKVKSPDEISVKDGTSLAKKSTKRGKEAPVKLVGKLVDWVDDAKVSPLDRKRRSSKQKEDGSPDLKEQTTKQTTKQIVEMKKQKKQPTDKEPARKQQSPRGKNKQSNPEVIKMESEVDSIVSPPKQNAGGLLVYSVFEDDDRPSNKKPKVAPVDPESMTKCPLCNFPTKQSKLQTHRSLPHKSKCDIEGCTLSFKSDKDVLHHRFLSHKLNPTCLLKCEECDEIFDEKYKNSYQVHIKNGKHLSCEKCEKKFSSSNKDLFRYHMEQDHSSLTDLCCSICPAAYLPGDRARYTEHVARDHNVGPCYHCLAEVRFVSVPRFFEHHQNNHVGEDCDCIVDPVMVTVKRELIIKPEDACDLTELLINEVSVDDEDDFYIEDKDEGNKEIITAECLEDGKGLKEAGEVECLEDGKVSMEAVENLGVKVGTVNNVDVGRKANVVAAQGRNRDHVDETNGDNAVKGGSVVQVILRDDDKILIKEEPETVEVKIVTNSGHEVDVEEEELTVRRGPEVRTYQKRWGRKISEDFEIQDSAISTTSTSLNSPGSEKLELPEAVPEVSSSHFVEELSSTDSEEMKNEFDTAEVSLMDDFLIEDDDQVSVKDENALTERSLTDICVVETENRGSVKEFPCFLVPYGDTDSESESFIGDSNTPANLTPTKELSSSAGIGPEDELKVCDNENVNIGVKEEITDDDKKEHTIIHQDNIPFKQINESSLQALIAVKEIDILSREKPVKQIASKGLPTVSNELKYPKQLPGQNSDFSRLHNVEPSHPPQLSPLSVTPVEEQKSEEVGPPSPPKPHLFIKKGDILKVNSTGKQGSSERKKRKIKDVRPVSSGAQTFVSSNTEINESPTSSTVMENSMEEGIFKTSASQNQEHGQVCELNQLKINLKEIIDPSVDTTSTRMAENEVIADIPPVSDLPSPQELNNLSSCLSAEHSTTFQEDVNVKVEMKDSLAIKSRLSSEPRPHSPTSEVAGTSTGKEESKGNHDISDECQSQQLDNLLKREEEVEIEDPYFSQSSMDSSSSLDQFMVKFDSYLDLEEVGGSQRETKTVKIVDAVTPSSSAEPNLDSFHDNESHSSAEVHKSLEERGKEQPVNKLAKHDSDEVRPEHEPDKIGQLNYQKECLPQLPFSSNLCEGTASNDSLGSEDHGSSLNRRSFEKEVPEECESSPANPHNRIKGRISPYLEEEVDPTNKELARAMARVEKTRGLRISLPVKPLDARPAIPAYIQTDELINFHKEQQSSSQPKDDKVISPSYTQGNMLVNLKNEHQIIQADRPININSTLQTYQTNPELKKDNVISSNRPPTVDKIVKAAIHCETVQDLLNEHQDIQADRPMNISSEQHAKEDNVFSPNRPPAVNMIVNAASHCETVQELLNVVRPQEHPQNKDEQPPIKVEVIYTQSLNQLSEKKLAQPKILPAVHPKVENNQLPFNMEVHSTSQLSIKKLPCQRTPALHISQLRTHLSTPAEQSIEQKYAGIESLEMQVPSSSFLSSQNPNVATTESAPQKTVEPSPEPSTKKRFSRIEPQHPNRPICSQPLGPTPPFPPPGIPAHSNDPQLLGAPPLLDVGVRSSSLSDAEVSIHPRPPDDVVRFPPPLPKDLFPVKPTPPPPKSPHPDTHSPQHILSNSRNQLMPRTAGRESKRKPPRIKQIGLTGQEMSLLSNISQPPPPPPNMSQPLPPHLNISLTPPPSIRPVPGYKTSSPVTGYKTSPVTGYKTSPAPGYKTVSPAPGCKTKNQAFVPYSRAPVIQVNPAKDSQRQENTFVETASRTVSKNTVDTDCQGHSSGMSEKKYVSKKKSSAASDIYNFDIGEKLDDLEQTIDDEENEESLESIKALLESQVPSTDVSELKAFANCHHSLSQEAPVFISDSEDELGLYSPGTSKIESDENFEEKTSVPEEKFSISVGKCESHPPVKSPIKPLGADWSSKFSSVSVPPSNEAKSNIDLHVKKELFHHKKQLTPSPSKPENTLKKSPADSPRKSEAPLDLFRDFFGTDGKVKVAAKPMQKSPKPDNYDDVDDLLGDTDDETDDEEILPSTPVKPAASNTQSQSSLTIPIPAKDPPQESPISIPAQATASPFKPPHRVPPPSFDSPMATSSSMIEQQTKKRPPPQYQCPECGEKYGSGRGKEREYNTHIRQPHNFPCQFCPLRFTFINGLEEHTNTKHIGESAVSNYASFLCDLCNKSFTRQGPFEKHKKREHNMPCSRCHMSFTNEPFLEEHLNLVHGITSPPPVSRPVEVSKPSSPVSVKFKLANGIINDSPPRGQEGSSRSNLNMIRPLDRKPFKMIRSMQRKSSGSTKVTNTGENSQEALECSEEDDTLCAQCGQNFDLLESFEKHIEQSHDHQCFVQDCDLSFVHPYYLNLHAFTAHAVGNLPDERERPVEEMGRGDRNKDNQEDNSFEEVIGISDLDVSEDYLSKKIEDDKKTTANLRNYRIPKKGSGFSPGGNVINLDSSLESSFNSSGESSSDDPSLEHLRCYQCGDQVMFRNRAALDAHIYSVHNSPGKEDTRGGFRRDSHTCFQCNLQFDTRSELDSHVKEHYSPVRMDTNRLQPAPKPKMLRCPLCRDQFSDMHTMMEHLKVQHKSGRADTQHNYWCGKCKKRFESVRKFEEHEKMEHKYTCQHCHKAYILEVDLKHHTEKAHRAGQVHTKEGFNCRQCGVIFEGIEAFKMHQLTPHQVPCYMSGCDRRYQARNQLVDHLKQDHHVVQIKIGANTEFESRVSLTTERSQENKHIAQWAESWINSPLAVDHMVKVMKAQVKSRRHDLFLDKRERDHCSGSETSRLYQLSNPGFLGGGGEKDTAVIKQLIDRVFFSHFDSADTNLLNLGKENTAFVYASCVLFPETFIHQHQVQGKSREEAEQAFMEVAVDVEERRGLSQEIREAAVRNRTEDTGDSGDEWVDHSDISDDEEND